MGNDRQQLPRSTPRKTNAHITLPWMQSRQQLGAQASHLGGLLQAVGLAVGFAALAAFLSSSANLLTFWGTKMKGLVVHLTVSPFVPSSTRLQGGKSTLLMDSQVALWRKSVYREGGRSRDSVGGTHPLHCHLW